VGVPVSPRDVFVPGGGPAGSTITGLLAERGWDVVIADKERHPRLHIGESLLPSNLLLLDRLGVREQVDRIGLIKYGAEFTSPPHGPPVTLEFRNACDKVFSHACEVRRSVFDHILFTNSIARGVRAFKCVYYLNNRTHPWRSFKARCGHRRAIKHRQDESPAYA
jgi:2-polyprenyl-6-methoxyphenol hydroxylase-like FAD-dependent oxidoreductase